MLYKIDKIFKIFLVFKGEQYLLLNSIEPMVYVWHSYFDLFATSQKYVTFSRNWNSYFRHFPIVSALRQLTLGKVIVEQSPATLFSPKTVHGLTHFGQSIVIVFHWSMTFAKNYFLKKLHFIWVAMGFHTSPKGHHFIVTIFLYPKPIWICIHLSDGKGLRKIFL